MRFLLYIGAVAIFIVSGILYGFSDGIVIMFSILVAIAIAGETAQILKRRRLEQEANENDENYRNDW